MSYRLTGFIYSSDRYQVASYGHGAAYEITAMVDGDPSRFVQDDDATELGRVLGVEDDAVTYTGTDEEYVQYMDHYLSQYFQTVANGNQHEQER